MTIIKGKNIRLEKLSSDHIDALCDCLLGEPDGWFAQMYGINSPETLRSALQNRLKLNNEDTSRSFVTIELKSGKVAGLSHFMKIDNRNRQLEIGGTQVGRHFRRSAVNTETKLLMLTEAFEKMNFVRVYFKVDTENLISQKAMERIGTHREGCYRNEWILPDGRVRDCFIYSVIDSEWPLMKNRLIALLDRGPIAKQF